MFKHNLAALVLVLFSSVAFAERYPTGPNESMTPGSLCENADSYRYPEKIPYCERDVNTALKREIIATYDERFGYDIERMDRQAFKIDHYIPLCMGGSNNDDNLWPQHMSVYEVTDPLEQLLCEKMAQGSLKQDDAIDYIKEAKNNLNRVEDIIDAVSRL